MRRAIVFIMMVTFGTVVLSQEHSVGQFDLLFYGGLQFEHKKRIEWGGKKTTWSLNTGTEFFFFRWLSIGVDLNYGNEGLTYQKLSDGNFYTTPFINLYYYRLFYLSGSYTYHRTIDHGRQYPYSFEEHTFTVGAGKKIFINKHLLVDLGARFYHSKEYGIDTQDVHRTKKTLGLSINAGFLIYFNIGSKNKNESI